MFLVSFHEQTIKFDLHKKVGNKFENYITSYNVDKNITGMMPAPAQSSVMIYGYTARAKRNEISSNVYFDDYFAITEIDDKKCEHLLAEWGDTHPLFRNTIIFVAKSEVEAIAQTLKSRDEKFTGYDGANKNLCVYECKRHTEDQC